MTWSVNKERNRLETQLCTSNLDFCASYMAILNLHALLQDYPHVIGPASVSALKRVLEDKAHISQKQALFLFRAAADTLVSIVRTAPDDGLRDISMLVLKRIVDTASGYQHRAAAEALGSLPLIINGPSMCYEAAAEIPNIRWEDLLQKNEFTRVHSPVMIGRCLVAEIKEDDCLLVVKMADDDLSVQFLNREAAWMEAFHNQEFSLPVRFNIPIPIKCKGSFVFKLENAPLKNSIKTDNGSARCAICFLAHRDYFVYPYQIAGDRFAQQRFKEMLFRNAWLLGKLTAMGIIHTAPVPLFHNRIQRARRADGGIYEWDRGGRLDRWLNSCRYPNFGFTGIRDFEHFISVSKPGVELYRHIGTHILGLMLVAGSYFRNKEPDRRVFNPNSAPPDHRELFDGPFFEELVRGVFFNYYHGFVGKNFEYKLSFDFETFTQRLIEEMGVDRHMVEILRSTDQREMTDRTFRTFLNNQGFSEKEVDHIEKGREDLTIYSGPHLGGFNERISLPELIAFLSMVSAFCVAGKYCTDRNVSLSPTERQPRVV
jgi:hypothetical protein